MDALDERGDQIGRHVTALGGGNELGDVDTLQLVAGAVPFVLRPSAFELDRYRDGREQQELLLTMGGNIGTLGRSRGIPAE